MESELPSAARMLTTAGTGPGQSTRPELGPGLPDGRRELRDVSRHLLPPGVCPLAGSSRDDSDGDVVLLARLG